MESDHSETRHWLARAYRSWAAKSLTVGAVATLLDVAILLVCVHGLRFPNPIAAMVGVAFGSTLTFFANRRFAFRDHDSQMAPQAMKFALVTGIGMLAHGGCVYLLADRLGVQVVIAKLVADLAVFSVGQLLLLRYVVFAGGGVKKESPRDAPPLRRPDARSPGMTRARRSRNG